MNANDDWVKVELWRWQYGDLPKPNDMRPLSLPDALRALALAIEEGCKSGDASKMPSPQNVCEVLKFCARKLTPPGPPHPPRPKGPPAIA